MLAFVEVLFVSLALSTLHCCDCSFSSLRVDPGDKTTKDIFFDLFSSPPPLNQQSEYNVLSIGLCAGCLGV